jgi:hypothetical protein
MSRKEFEAVLELLQNELVTLPEWVKASVSKSACCFKAAIWPARVV